VPAESWPTPCVGIREARGRTIFMLAEPGSTVPKFTQGNVLGRGIEVRSIRTISDAEARFGHTWIGLRDLPTAVS